MEENIMKIDFAFTDEFGNESRLTKSFTEGSSMDTDLSFLVDEFKYFLLGIGFAQNTVDCIQIVEDEE